MKIKLKSLAICLLAHLLIVTVANADSIELVGETTFTGDTFKVGISVNAKSGDSNVKVAGLQANSFMFNGDSKLTMADFPSNIKSCDIEEIGKYVTFIGDTLISYVSDPKNALTNPGTVANIVCTVNDNFKVGDSIKLSIGEGLISSDEGKSSSTKGSSITVKKVEKEVEESENDKPDSGSQPEDSNKTDDGSNKTEEKKYSCQKVDGKFYNKNGEEVSKVDYDKSCAVNPDTGFNFPLALVVCGIVTLIGIHVKNKGKNKFFKI